MDSKCVSLAIFSLLFIQVYGNAPVDHNVYLCGNGKADDTNKCTKENYYGLFLNGLNLINSCSDEKTDNKVQNLLHCVQYGQDPTGESCRKNEKECRACQCLTLCVLKGLGIVDKAGKVDEQVLKEVVHMVQFKVKEFKDFDSNWAICKENSVIGADPCERTYNTMMCLINQDYKRAMDITYVFMLDLVLAQQQCGKNLKCTKYPTFED